MEHCTSLDKITYSKTLLGQVLWFVSLLPLQNIDQKQLRDKGGCFSFFILLVLVDHGRRPRQELKQRAWRKARFLRLAQLFSSHEIPSSRGSQFVFSVAVISSDQNQLVEGKVHLSWASQSITARSQKLGQELRARTNREAGAEVETAEKHCLQPASTWLAQPARSVFSYHLGPPSQVWHRPSWPGTSHIIINKEMTAQTHLQVKQMEAIPQLRFLLHR